MSFKAFAVDSGFRDKLSLGMVAGTMNQLHFMGFDWIAWGAIRFKIKRHAGLLPQARLGQLVRGSPIPQYLLGSRRHGPSGCQTSASLSAAANLPKGFPTREFASALIVQWSSRDSWQPAGICTRPPPSRARGPPPPSPVARGLTCSGQTEGAWNDRNWS